MANPLVSVIIPTFNHGLFVEEAIRSVENLADERIEIIVVDDGSTDESSKAISKKLQTLGYNIFIRENQGVAASRNFGIRQAKGKYIIPLDADNRILAPYISYGIDILENNPDVAVVFGDAKIFGEKGGTWVNHSLKLEEIVFENYIDNCTIYRKIAWESVNGYDEHAPFHTREDWFFWLALLGKGWKFEYLNEFCFEYRFLENSKVRTKYSVLRNRLIINAYIFPVQIKLLKKFMASGDLPQKTVRSLTARLQSQLAHYHFVTGSVLKGYGFLFKALGSGLAPGRFLNQAIGWPVRRLRSVK
jgi:glycosyltransferase involved in cell wall biosynthesis